MVAYLFAQGSQSQDVVQGQGLKPQETPLLPHLHARRPRAQQKGAGAASRVCSVISQWPVAPHYMTRSTNAWRPPSRLLVARWPQPRLVCSAWLVAVETSDPTQSLRRASACEGLLRRMLSLRREPKWRPHPATSFRFRGLNPGIRISAIKRAPAP